MTLSRRHVLGAAVVLSTLAHREAASAQEGGARVVLLGTAGGPSPKVSRAAPANMVVVGGSLYVVDCGNGVARQIVRAGFQLKDLKGISSPITIPITTLITAICSTWPGAQRSRTASIRMVRRRW
jgi:hypothetical protein